MKRLVQIIVLLQVLWIVICLCTGCSINTEQSQNETVSISDFPAIRKMASEMNDETGWYFQFYYEASRENPGDRVYAFRGINLRYRYDEDYWSVTYQKNRDRDGNPIYLRIRSKNGTLMYGLGGEAQLRDRMIMRQILNRSRTPEALLAENPDAYRFETIDKELFFRLIRKALSGPEAPVSENEAYWGQPEWAAMVEPDYLDGYKFQIIFQMANNYIDGLYIDLLYKTGENYNDYVQLSDLVQNHEASQDQEEAFRLIMQIRTDILRENLFIANIESYKEKQIAGIDFARLAEFLQASHENRTGGIYSSISENVPRLIEEISEEEFEAAQLK